MAPRRGAFLDRDGVLNARPPEHEYVRSKKAFHWLPGACEAVAQLSREGFVPIVVSNQRGIALGQVTPQTIQAIEQVIQRDLQRLGAAITDFYYCPHDLHEGCDCRKPKPGLLLRAASEHDLDVASSVMIGDSESDVDAGRAAGCFTIRVATGTSTTTTRADLVADSLHSAVARLLRREGSRAAMVPP